MKKNKLYISILAALMVLPACAQKRKVPAKKKVVPVVEVVEDPKFVEMLEATQQIVFIDSIVVNKQEFLQFYKLTSEAGTIAAYNNFFKSEDQPYSTVYVNQLGNKCWYANDGHLYTSDLLGSQWSEPAPLEGLGRFQRANYPYMLSDGMTLYFAAISNEGLGGLDIYVSRYDSESGKFLLSENIGLPFNSDANDYMYAIDEFNSIGFFATDRRQPEGKVCIYTFIPNQKRVVYTSEEFDGDTIRSRARIDRIADTWGDGEARQLALERLMTEKQIQTTKKPKQDFSFIINDNLVYTKLTDFRDADNRDRYNELCAMRNRYESLRAELEKSRNYYATKARQAEKENLHSQILNSEKTFYQLELGIQQLEKDIRIAENRNLKP